MISGIQHMAFCERQWALIHIEQQWKENVLTLEGQFLHKKTDDPFFNDWRNSVRTIRSVPLVSFILGLTGIADIVELVSTETDSGVIQDASINTKLSHIDIKKPWASMRPVEYKRGKPKPDDRDQVQLCAQAMCLEEMNNIIIDFGNIFYGEIRRREEVEFSSELRQRVRDLSEKMHRYFRESFTPPPIYKNHCKACSLFNICLPKPLSKNRSVIAYLNNYFEG